ncbi:multidrug-resistance transporte [Scheffersomyces coipomensis]|uniref:multidrug-resistance transporte n=1 Tax=Scheffersomyces coipomensis TaxID=1788519 RepID=UPI00315D4DEE
MSNSLADTVDNQSIDKQMISNMSRDKNKSLNQDSNNSQDTSQEDQVQQGGAGDGTKEEDQYLEGMKLVACVFSVLVCLFLIGLDQTIVITLLSTVGNKFNALDKIGWLSSGYLLTVCVFAPFWGMFSISFGRKLTMIISVVLFEVGSLICALSVNMEMLIFGRALSGVGGGGIQSLTFIIISEVVPLHKRPLTMAFVGVTYAISSVLGPIIGGAFTTKVSWRWSFYVNLPIGGLALAIFFFSFNPPKVKGSIKQKLAKIDFLGTILIVGGLILILLALTFGASYQYKWKSGIVISFFIVGAILIAGFIVWNFKYSKYPLILPSAVKILQVNAGAISIFFMYAYFIALTLYLSIYFQIVKDKSALQSGISEFPIIISIVVSSILSGVLIKKTNNVKTMYIISGILGPIGLGLFTLYDIDTTSGKSIGLQIISGISMGIMLNSTIISAQVSAPKVPGGTILTITYIVFARCLGGAIGANLSDVVYNSSFINLYRKHLAKEVNQLIIRELGQVSPYQMLYSTASIADLSLESQLFIKTLFNQSIRNVYYMCIIFSGISMIACFFTTNKPIPDAEEEVSLNKEDV